MGRPSRINLSDCDMPVPTAHDVEELSTDIPRCIYEKYFPDDERRALPRMFTSLLEATFALWRVLTTHYKAKREVDRDLVSALDRDRAELVRCRSGFPSEESCDSPVVLSHLYHLQIYYE